ncbi:MAG: hypothetical protein ACLULL_06175 [Parabacteroides distasonis]
MLTGASFTVRIFVRKWHKIWQLSKRCPPRYVRKKGDTVVVKTVRPGDFVVCNLASLSLGHLPLEDEEQIKESKHPWCVLSTNVIDLNFYPLPFLHKSPTSVTAVSDWGVSGYHRALAMHAISAGKVEEHLRFCRPSIRTD